MTQLGTWVIEKACAQQAHWRNSAMPKLTIWVNISALQLFQGDLESQLATCLKRYQLKPSQIGLELTESVLLDERAPASKQEDSPGLPLMTGLAALAVIALRRRD